MTMKNRTAIITKGKVPVATSFENEECRMIRTIISRTNDNDARKSKFVIRTNACNYYEREEPLFNPDGTPQEDAEGNQLTKTVEELKVLHKIGKESVRIFPYTTIDALAEAVAPLIPEGISQTQKDNIQEQLALLQFTQTDSENNGQPPYGTLVEDWELLNENDWIKDVI